MIPACIEYARTWFLTLSVGNLFIPTLRELIQVFALNKYILFGLLFIIASGLAADKLWIIDDGGVPGVYSNLRYGATNGVTTFTPFAPPAGCAIGSNNGNDYSIGKAGVDGKLTFLCSTPITSTSVFKLVDGSWSQIGTTIGSFGTSGLNGVVSLGANDFLAYQNELRYQYSGSSWVARNDGTVSINDYAVFDNIYWAGGANGANSYLKYLSGSTWTTPSGIPAVVKNIFKMEPTTGKMALVTYYDDGGTQKVAIYERTTAGAWTPLVGNQPFMTGSGSQFDIAYYESNLYVTDGATNVWYWSFTNWVAINPPTTCKQLAVFGDKLFCVGPTPQPTPQGTRYCLNSACSGTPNVMIGGGSQCTGLDCVPATCSGGNEVCDSSKGCLQISTIKSCSPFAQAYFVSTFADLPTCLSQCSITGGPCSTAQGAECTLSNSQYACFCMQAPVGSFHASVNGAEKGVLHYGYDYETKSIDLGEEGTVTVRHVNSDVGLIDFIALDGVASQVIDLTTGEDISLKVAAADGVVADVSGHELLLGSGRVLTMTASEYDVRSIEKGITLLAGGNDKLYSWNDVTWVDEGAPGAIKSMIVASEPGGTPSCTGSGTGFYAISPNSNIGVSWPATCTAYGGEVLSFTAGASTIDAVKVTLPVQFTPAAQAGVTVDAPYAASAISVAGSEINIDFTPNLPAAATAVIRIGGSQFVAPDTPNTYSWAVASKGTEGGCALLSVGFQQTVTVVNPLPVSISIDAPHRWVSLLTGDTSSAYTWTCTDACGFTPTRGSGACLFTPVISAPCVTTYNSVPNTVPAGSTTGLCSVTGTVGSVSAVGELVVYAAEDKQWSGSVTHGVTPAPHLGVTFTPNTDGTFYLTEFVDDGSFAAAGGAAGCGPWDFYNTGSGTVSISKGSCPTTCLTKPAGGSWSSVACSEVPATGAGGGFGVGGGGGAATGGRVYSAPAFDLLGIAALMALAVLVVVIVLYKKK
jgi:hypothetical protein